MPGDVDWTPLCDTMANLTDLPIFTDQMCIRAIEGIKNVGGRGGKEGKVYKIAPSFENYCATVSNLIIGDGGVSISGVCPRLFCINYL